MLAVLERSHALSLLSLANVVIRHSYSLQVIVYEWGREHVWMGWLLDPAIVVL